jgi:hypothetical protein
MRAFTRPAFWPIVRHRLAVACTFFAYLLATLSIPLPVAIHKDASQPFPCQDHPCGCQTAEQCWRSCCCFTAEQRWAWARGHHVEPPAYAEKPAPAEKPTEGGWNTVKLRDQAKTPTAPAKSCCSTKPAPSACCQSRSERPAKQSSPKRERVLWTMGLFAWQCQGSPTLWVSAGSVLPIPPPVVWSPDQPPLFRVPLMDAVAGDVPLTPPAPPPRLSFV